MKDIIDLGNKVFDYLIDKHNELPESRTLFLYSITAGTPWYIINTNNVLIIEEAGITINFIDAELTIINDEWLAIQFEKKRKLANSILQKIKSETNSPREGDTYEFWKNEEPFRNITFNF